MNREPEILQARLWDTLPLARILWDFTRQADWLPPARGRIQDMTLIARLIERGAVRLIRDGKGPCAFIAREDTVIQALYVHSRARRHGHGRRLLKEAKTLVPSLSLWTYEAAHVARHFYACEGFTPAAWGDGRGNDEHLPELLLLWTAPTRATEAA